MFEYILSKYSIIFVVDFSKLLTSCECGGFYRIETQSHEAERRMYVVDLQTEGDNSVIPPCAKPARIERQEDVVVCNDASIVRTGG